MRKIAVLGLGKVGALAALLLHEAGFHTNDLAVPGQPSVHLDEINKQILTTLETHRA